MVDDDVMSVNFIRSKLLDETFGLVQGQELGYANTHKRGLFLQKKRNSCGDFKLWLDVTNGKRGTNWVFELAIDFRNHLTHGFQFREHVVGAIRLTSHQTRHLQIGN